MIEAEKPREDHLKAWYSHVKQPESMNSRIWRYMDFAKFVSMLETQCLFFSRLDCLGDPFEGTVTTPHNERFLSRVTSKSQREEFENMCKIVRTHIFVSCWNLSEHENDALWKIYGLSKESVAVRTSYGKLRSVPNVKAGKVEYRTDRFGNIHVVIGKANLEASKLAENYAAVLDEIQRMKPAASKGKYIKNVSISTTMGPGIKVAVA